MPYLRRINSTLTKGYASRTLLFLKNDGTLKPLAIELSLPHPDGDIFGAISEVYTPAEEGVNGSIWQLAKAYVVANDSGIHELISHWLNTHAVGEPFVIATNRQLSVLHRIYKLLRPGLRDTMIVNAYARQNLINAGGILESTVFPRKYFMEMSSLLYKKWVFTEQALPADLIKRGVAVMDPDTPHGIRVLIEDYAYAVVGLEFWSTIKGWVEHYCSYYYKNDDDIQNDSELQSWWKEVRDEGHADLKKESWWPLMKTREDLVDTCTIILWMASCLHRCCNYGQYPWLGFCLERPRPIRSCRFMPTPEQLQENLEKVFLKTIFMDSCTKPLLSITTIEFLLWYFYDKEYTDDEKWTADEEILEAHECYRKKIEEIYQSRVPSSRYFTNILP